jgi:septal ring factor EnvC (AmiA/AmiB activator)
MMKKLVIGLLAFAFSLSAHAQETKEDIQRKQHTIATGNFSTNSTLSQIKKNKKQSLGQLALVRRKISARQELINSINKELHHLDDTIYTNQIKIYRLKKELDTLKDQYAKSLLFAYKNRSNYGLFNFFFLPPVLTMQ